MTEELNLHEDLNRENTVLRGSDRAFGITFGVVFSAIAAISWWHGSSHAIGWLAGAAGFLITGLLAPRLLGPLNRLWFQLGFLLQRIVSPAVLALMFFFVIAPIGLLMRALGKRPLNLDIDRGTTTSYWIKRDPAKPDDSFFNQF